MSDSRLFKATRRSIRAEVTLIVVIVISFTWSAYALYKLALGSSDSFYDFGLGQSKSNRQHAAQPGQSKPNHEVVHLDARNLSEQLAIYKSQILKELMARQKQLLADDLTHRYQAAPTSLNGQHAGQIDASLKPASIEELKRWRGGYRMPTPIDYLFEASKQTGQQPINGSLIDRVPSGSTDQPRGSPNSAQIPLADAPSLMQLSKFKPAGNQGVKPVTARLEQYTQSLGDNESNDSSSDDPLLHNQDASSDEQPVTERQSQSDLTTTTTIAPNFYEQETAETTTLEPVSESPQVDVETSPSPVDGGTEEGTSNKDEYLSDQDLARPEQERLEENKRNANKDDGEANDDDGSMERVKNTVHAIDEEVDRMTQPSLGMASQQDKSFDYKNTVQFDDGLPGSIQRELDHDIAHKVPKSTEAAFQQDEQRPSQRQPDADNETDLQVADNRAKSPVGVTHATGPSKAKLEKLGAEQRQPAKFKKAETLRKNERFKARSADNPTRARAISSVRQRRSIETNLISKTLDSIEPKDRANKNRKSSRRSDDQDESDGDDQSDSNQDDGQEDSSDGNHSESRESPGEKLRSSYQTITSSDPTLQELLAHKRLLDELQQSQVPPPVAWAPKPGTQLLPQQQTLNSTFLEPSRPNRLLGEGKAGHTDHQPADAQYTVDQGLLLYPAEDEEHHHKSMSKKSKKASHKKAKKKMTVAMKKGGHKKKKHKKEEKKYLKEKKFKGAKKGKKMSKGKGGKGGKKGKKYYKDKGFKKKGFKNIYVKNEFGQKKSYFDEFRDKDFKKKWKNFDDKYNYAQMKKWQAKDVKGAKKMKDQGEDYKKYDKGKWKKKYHKNQESESAKKKKKMDEF